MYNKGPFADWVPKPLMLLLIILFLFPILGVSGVFSNNMGDISGVMGAYTEHITMVNNAATIGMMLAMPILMRVKMRFRTKEIMVTCCVTLAALVLMCGTTHNYAVFVAGNLLIGFFKMFATLEIVIVVMFILSPTGDRKQFYSIFYPIAIGSSSLMFYYLSDLIFDYGITSAYYLIAAIMLGLAVLSLIFQHNQRFSFKMPLYQVDWLSMLLLTVSFMCMNYALVFMRQQNWLNSLSIQWTLIVSILTFIWLVVRQKGKKRPFIDFSGFKLSSVKHSMILLIFLGFYLSSTSVFMQWNMGALGYNSLVNAKLGLWGLPGLILGGILGGIGFKKEWNIKYFILMGFGAFFLHSLLIYLTIQPNMNIEMFYLPVMLRNFGMVILFIGIWFYATNSLPAMASLGVIGILLAYRTFLVTGIAGAVMGFGSYQMQLQSLTDMSNYWDINLMGPAAIRGYGSMQIGALLASGKTMMGWLCWLFIPVALFILNHSYGKMNFRKWSLFRKKIKGNDEEGYHLDIN